MLPDGRVLVAGGDDGEGAPPRSTTRRPGRLDRDIAHVDNRHQQGRVLPDGTVLVHRWRDDPSKEADRIVNLASAELYDPESRHLDRNREHGTGAAPLPHGHGATRRHRARGGWHGQHGGERRRPPSCFSTEPRRLSPERLRAPRAPLGGGLMLVYRSHETSPLAASAGRRPTISSAWMPARGCRPSSGPWRWTVRRGISACSGQPIESTSS